MRSNVNVLLFQTQVLLTSLYVHLNGRDGVMYCVSHYVSKRRWLSIVITQLILIIFGRNVAAEIVCDRTAVCFFSPAEIMYLHCLGKHEPRNWWVFSLKRCMCIASSINTKHIIIIIIIIMLWMKFCLSVYSTGHHRTVQATSQFSCMLQCKILNYIFPKPRTELKWFHHNIYAVMWILVHSSCMVA